LLEREGDPPDPDNRWRQVVGILTLVDIAVERDSRTVLADSSAAPRIHERTGHRRIYAIG